MSAPDPVCRIGVISDTHGRLSNRVFEIFTGVNLILHAGDIGNEDVLTMLETIAPVTAVRGNVDGFCDPALRPLIRTLDTAAGRIVMTHGHLPGAPSGNLTKMVAHFRESKPDIIIYGHSHIPELVEVGGVTLFNPGSASQHRWGRGNTVGMITVLETGQRPAFEHVIVD